VNPGVVLLVWIGAAAGPTGAPTTAAPQTSAEVAGVAGGQTAGSETRAASLQLRAGAGKARFAHATLGEASGHGLSFEVAAQMRIGAFVLAASVPLAVVSVGQPAGAYVDQTVLGNPTLSATLNQAAGGFGLGLTLPVAGRGAQDALLANRALALASAFDGWTRPELWSPGRIALVPFGHIGAGAGRWSVAAAARMAVSLRVADRERLDGWSSDWLGVAPAFDVGGAVKAAGNLYAGLTGEAAANFGGPTGPGTLWQLTLRPGLTWRSVGGSGLRADFVVPLAGSAGGHALALGLRWEQPW
jgi:hypothetical protein